MGITAYIFWFLLVLLDVILAFRLVRALRLLEEEKKKCQGLMLAIAELLPIAEFGSECWKSRAIREVIELPVAIGIAKSFAIDLTKPGMN